MSEVSTKGKKGVPFWKKMLFGCLATKKASHQIAYIGVMVALSIVVNVYSIPLGFIQLSLTMFVSILTGLILGGAFGFTTCFVGDTVGFFIDPKGNFTPWVGLSMGMAALLAALIMYGIPLKAKGLWAVKLVLICIFTFLVCTWAINTTAGYYLWNKAGYPYWKFVVVRFSGQIWNSLINYALLFVVVPALNRIKPLKLNIK